MLKLPKLNILWLNKAVIPAITLVLAFNMPVGRANAFENLFLITGSDALISVNAPLRQKTIRAILTAYSSTVDQTDDTPFTTASNTTVRDGVVASNFLAFGTKVQIPSLFGDKVFTVEDRMAKKHNDKIDVWFSERHSAKQFGIIKDVEVVILN